MSLTRPLALVALSLTALALCASPAMMPSAAHAQNQVKPYFLVVFDTSGSMTDEPTVTNTCGYTSGGRADSRKLDAAKCALGKLVNSTGDANFGLMQFAQTWDGNGSCTGGSCSPEAASALLRVPIATNTAATIASLYAPYIVAVDVRRLVSLLRRKCYKIPIAEPRLLTSAATIASLYAPCIVAVDVRRLVGLLRRNSSKIRLAAPRLLTAAATIASRYAPCNQAVDVRVLVSPRRRFGAEGSGRAGFG